MRQFWEKNSFILDGYGTLFFDWDIRLCQRVQNCEQIPLHFLRGRIGCQSIQNYNWLKQMVKQENFGKIFFLFQKKCDWHVRCITNRQLIAN
jgi:hypothetical protein